MKDKKEALKGKEGFENYYQEIFGERWNAIKESFLGPNQSVEYKIDNCDSYFLDSASVFAALSLPLKGAHKILDLCAAPGGKTLVLASRMEEDAILEANERSPDRKRRLDTVINTCLPESINSRVKTFCSDGASWCKKKSECYDRILLDAPCSSERHVYLDKKYLDIWTKARVKTVSMEQWALLSCAYRLLEVNGIMVYSTCALSPLENDLNLEKLNKKFNKDNNGFVFLDVDCDLKEIQKYTTITLPGFEKTKYGYAILPDKQNGAGPIYFSVIKKISSFNA